MPGYSQTVRNFGSVQRHIFDWTSNSSGVASVVSNVPISGIIRRVVFQPSSTAAPTDLYDVVLTDSESMDVLAGQGANLGTATTSNVCPGVPLKDGTTTSVAPMAVNSILTLAVRTAKAWTFWLVRVRTFSNAGDTKSGKVILYVE
ncbi:MAG: hypothetical protein E6R03_04525 [Hyphomicrobiaceae bacterium]|nr:MAG: hypothetical protein E6R03_04525 [Hyphomicrobiaceae bacterium]